MADAYDAFIQGRQAGQQNRLQRIQIQQAEQQQPLQLRQQQAQTGLAEAQLSQFQSAEQIVAEQRKAQQDANLLNVVLSQPPESQQEAFAQIANRLDPDTLQYFTDSTGRIAFDPNRAQMVQQMAQQFQQMSPQELTASMKEHQYYQKLPPEERESFMALKRGPQTTPETYRAREEAKVVGRERGKKIAQRGKRQVSLEGIEAQVQNVSELIDQAKDQANAWTTGLLGQALQEVGGTPAHNLQQTLQTVKAAIGFDKLQEMRANSPTGGALGQVSDRENKLLQSVYAALEQSQSPAQFKANLERVRKQMRLSWQRVAKAYEQDYDEPYRDQPVQDESTTPQQAPVQQYTEGQTATNPTTGEKLIYRGGQWQRL